MSATFSSALGTAIEIVLPVVAMLAIGRVYSRLKEFGPELTRGIGSLVFWVCLPALTFKEIVRADLSAAVEPRICLSLFTLICLCAFLGYRYARAVGAEENQVGVIAQGSFRSNMLYIGLPIIIYYAQARAEQLPVAEAKSIRDRIVELTAFSTAFSVPILNAVSILVFELPGRKRPGRQLSPATLAARIALNPLVVAVALAVCASLWAPSRNFFDPARIAGKTVDLAASAALPMVLFSIGANLDFRRARRGWRQTLPVAAIKLFLMPALGLALMTFLGLRGPALVTGVILLACPDAASGHAMAAEYDADEELAGELVAVTTVSCPFTLVFWLSVLSFFG